jgi:putative endonuclease
MKTKYSYIYILMNKVNTVSYVGVTSNLIKRVYEHKNKLVDSFTAKYNIDKLVYFEVFEDINNAIKREKQLKNWHREWKVNLIKQLNPTFKDLYSDILE